jgi:hypothetical protein
VKNFAIALWLAQVLAAIGMLIAVVIDIETILVTGPILAAVGLLLALATGSIQSWSALAFSLSGPFVTAFISFLIAVFDFSPEEAYTPTIAVLITYLALFWPIAFMAFLRIRRWRTTAIGFNRPVVRFSMKTLLIVMTATCIVIAGGKLLFDSLPPDEAYLFGGFTFTVLVLSSLVVWRCLAYPFRGKISDPSPRQIL